MSRLEDKLRLHFADKDAVWSDTWAGALVGATWEEGGSRRLLLGVAPPLLAARVVDAHMMSVDAGASHVTLAFEGSVTPVARTAAERLGVSLLDASDLPLPVPVAVPVALAPEPEPTAAPPLLTAGLTTPLLVAHAAHAPPAPLAFDAPEGIVEAVEAGALPAPTDEPPFVDPGSGALDADLLAHVDDLVHALDDEPVLPWHGPAPSLDVEPAVVDPMEVLAMPWHHPDHARPDEHVEVMAGNDRPRPLAPLLRPTQAPDWGLPWPRPPAPADGLAIVDPKLWGTRERVRAVHDDLDRMGGGSFGQVKPGGDPSAWLRRLQTGL